MSSSLTPETGSLHFGAGGDQSQGPTTLVMWRFDLEGTPQGDLEPLAFSVRH
ncbi:MAG TPA: hypothetical protein VJN70_05415 [Gemmatimonadaceae bacterium]|nr:hypothetical protein [Gemmatimonadaceae bacterium]